jgi:hypothetical protein
MSLQWSIHKKIACIFTALLLLFTTSIVTCNEALFTSSLKIESYHPDESVTFSENSSFKLKHLSHVATHNSGMGFREEASFHFFIEDLLNPTLTACPHNPCRAPPFIFS